MRRIVFVCRAVKGEALRSAKAISELADVKLLCVCEDAAGPEEFADVVRVENVYNVEQLIAAAKRLGDPAILVTAQETLLAPVAETNEALRLDAMSPEVVARTLDKSKLKSTLKNAGVQTPRDQIVTNVEEARRFAQEVGFPIVIKPLNGSGALSTFCIRDDEQLARIMELINGPVLAETFVMGEELCFDTVTIANEPQCFTVCRYEPPIIQALEDPTRQWRCVMPRQVEPYDDFIREGLAAVRALKVGNAITHMEGFMNGASPAGFIDATLRPAGARIGPMFGFAFDVDPYRLWARVAVDGAFDGPLERKFAVGTIFLRGSGSGSVEILDGLETVKQDLAHVIVEARWPRVRFPKSATYTGDGFVTVRHPDANVVREALDFVDKTIRITYTSADTAPANWDHRLRNFKELNRPAWEKTT